MFLLIYVMKPSTTLKKEQRVLSYKK